MKREKKEGRYICKCECGGQVRGSEAFGRTFSWCETCTPIVGPIIPKREKSEMKVLRWEPVPGRGSGMSKYDCFADTASGRWLIKKVDRAGTYALRLNNVEKGKFNNFREAQTFAEKSALNSVVAQPEEKQ